MGSASWWGLRDHVKPGFQQDLAENVQVGYLWTEVEGVLVQILPPETTVVGTLGSTLLKIPQALINLMKLERISSKNVVLQFLCPSWPFVLFDLELEIAELPSLAQYQRNNRRVTWLAQHNILFCIRYELAWLQKAYSFEVVSVGNFIFEKFCKWEFSFPTPQ